MSIPMLISMSDAHMEMIIKLYEEAEAIIEDLKIELANTKDALADGYEGLATSINEESIDRYIQHMDFLELCCQANREQVLLSQESLTAAG